MDKAIRNGTSRTKNIKRDGKGVNEKPMTLGLLRYEELIKEMEALNLPPTNLLEDERRARKLEGY